MACAMIKPAGSHSYLESAVERFQQAYYLKITSRSVVELERKQAVTIQQRRKFSSDADFIFSTKLQNPEDDHRTPHIISKFTVRKATFLRDKVLRKFQQVLSRSSVQATIQQVRDLGRIRAIDLLPDFVQIAGFVLPDFTPDPYTRLYQISDFGDRMDKAAMLEALKERRSKTKSGGASSSGAQNKEETSSGAPIKEKREASPEKKERRKKRRHEKRDTGSTHEPIPEVTISESEGTTNKGPKGKSSEEPYTLLDASKISFVSNPSGSASLDFIRHMVPDQDFDQLKRTPDLEVFESAGLHFMQAASRFSKAHAEVIKTKRSYDGVLGRHEALLKQLEEIQTKENVEKESLTAELESAQAKAQTYKAKAQSLETQVQSLEIQVQSLDARAQCAEEESKLRLAEVEKLQEERANSWALEKEKFLKSKDFDSLCLKKAVKYFDKGFEGCLAQFRANDFSEEEYPASFLNVEQALADMPEDQEEDSSGLGETPPA
ncbi:TMV resistance protein N-like [Dorcoceras hygrometricum]|uniref:TMV resistance protein N-like n=1 Tax=Dorcoceras hygrometricum TaxID=472368 RepID=A0A2Z7DKA2_9LAMI|nr:TMV resistance protein N-like [Dorcoceras hygrometricum]